MRKLDGGNKIEKIRWRKKERGNKMEETRKRKLDG